MTPVSRISLLKKKNVNKNRKIKDFVKFKFSFVKFFNSYKALHKKFTPLCRILLLIILLNFFKKNFIINLSKQRFNVYKL